MDKEILDKWKGIASNQKDWMSNQDDISSNGLSQSFQNFLPMAMKISAKTIGLDLVSVVPMGSTHYSRNRKLKTILENISNDKYNFSKSILGSPTGHIFYMDIKYGVDRKFKLKKILENI